MESHSLTRRRIMSLLYPETCICCGQPTGPERLVCFECAQRLRRPSPPFCRFCGLPLEDCTCRKQEHAYEQAVAPFFYEGTARDAIIHLKFGGREDAAVFLGKAMGDRAGAAYFGIPFDIVTCVPTTRARMAKRGFNQARSLGEQLGAACFSEKEPETDWHLLRKRGTGQTQHFLGASDRRRNIRGAFQLSPGRSVRGKTILLVDDIVTTGATADECAAVLRLNGAAAVYVVCAAMTRNTGPEYAGTKAAS